MKTYYVSNLAAKWIVAAADHIASDPQGVVSGFVKAGITALLSDEKVMVSEECPDSDSETDVEGEEVSDGTHDN